MAPSAALARRLPFVVVRGARGARRGGSVSARSASSYEAASAPPPQLAPPAVFGVDWSVYKGGGAVQAKPLPPTFERAVSSSGAHAVKLARPGVVLLEAAASVGGGGGGGRRTYDWQNKVTFALSLQEIGQLLVLASDPRQSVSMVHDPSLIGGGGASLGGQGDLKTFGVAPTPDGSGFFVSLEQRSQNARVSVPVTHGEFAVLAELCRYALPRLAGWEAALSAPASPQPKASEQWNW